MSLLLRRRAMMFAPAPDAWDYGWDYTMGAPDTNLWEYPIGSGTASYDAGNGLCLTYASGASYAGIRLIDRAQYNAQRAVLEVTLRVSLASANGIRIVLTAGSAGVSDGQGIHVTVNGNYLNVLRSTAALTSITGTAAFAYDTWHTVRLELDTPGNASRVYMDGGLVDTITNADLSTISVANTWTLAQDGQYDLRAIRYKKED